MIEMHHEEPDLLFTLAHGMEADPYAGLDRFDRTVDMRWTCCPVGSGSSGGCEAELVEQVCYGYDRASNRLWRANPVATAQNPAVYLDELYHYDGVSQLIGLERGQLSTGRDAVTNKAFAEDWSLDPTGNWTGFRQDLGGDGTWDLNQTRRHNKANEVMSASSWATPSHDRAGNMTSMPKPGGPADALATTFDAWNRMVKVEEGEDTVAEYAYTGDNRRALKKVYSGGALSETRHFYYTDQWQAIEERTALGGIIAADADTQYVWGTRYVDHLILRDRQTMTSGAVTERLYALRDPNWNVTALVDILGTPLERFTYTAYGAAEVRTPLFQPAGAPSLYAWPYTYTTRRLDEETGLMYYRNRMYHPELGQFVSRDSAGYGAGDMNLHRYCSNRPIIAADPLGAEIATRCPVDGFLRRNGVLSDYGSSVTGGMYQYRYSDAPIVVRNPSLVREILVGMINSQSVFAVLGETPDEIINNLMRHVHTRMAIVKNARTLHGLGFPTRDTPETTFHASAKAISEYLASPSEYTMNCTAAALVMMYGGILSSIGAAEFDVSPQALLAKRTVDPGENEVTSDVFPNLGPDWIPGDMGALGALKPNPSNKLLVSESLIYLGAIGGNPKWRGHMGKSLADEILNAKQWITIVSGWSMVKKAAKTPAELWFPTVGLDMTY